jgi:hypothetical protein
VTVSSKKRETKDFAKFLYTCSAASTTVAEAYNLLIDTDVREDDLTRRFSRYSKPNWDGYGAEPIAKETINSAKRFLRMLTTEFAEPEMAPGSDGIIAMEWLFEGDHPLRKIFIDIGPGNIWSAYYRRKDGRKRTIPQQPITEGTKAELLSFFEELRR